MRYLIITDIDFTSTRPKKFHKFKVHLPAMRAVRNPEKSLRIKKNTKTHRSKNKLKKIEYVTVTFAAFNYRPNTRNKGFKK